MPDFLLLNCLVFWVRVSFLGQGQIQGRDYVLVIAARPRTHEQTKTFVRHLRLIFTVMSA